MPQTCTICRHSDEVAINLALIGGEPYRSIAERTNTSKSALIRHKLSCLPKDLVQARQSEKIAQSDLLLAQVCRLQRRAERILTQAESSGDLRTALNAVRELRGTIELLSRLAGELRESAQVNVLLTSEYHEVRNVIVSALAPYPKARIAVAAALNRVSHAGA